MIAHDGTRFRVEWPKSAALVLILLNVIAYFVELVLLRAGSELPKDLALRPAIVVHEGKVWQLVTTLFLHDPARTGHLLYNMLWLWFVTPTLESAWGKYRVYATYAASGLAGALFTVAVGSLGTYVPLFENVWTASHMGASGAVMGLVIAWCLMFRDQTLNLLFLGPIRGIYFLGFVVLMEVLTALSYEPVSSTSHFGGMMAGAVLGLDLWRFGALKDMWRRFRLRSKKRDIEKKLTRFEVIDGGRRDRPRRGANPNDWVN